MANPFAGEPGLIAALVAGIIFFIVCHIPICIYFVKAIRYCKRRFVDKVPLPDLGELELGPSQEGDCEDPAYDLKKGKATSMLEIKTRIPELTGVEIKKQIGEGNYGDVFLGMWNGTKVALKKLKGKNEFEEFKKEAGTLFTLVHPNCVQFLGVYYETSSEGKKDYFIVLEYLSKGNCLELIRKEKSITALDLLRMALGAAKGMSYLENKSIVHGDLACRNLLVTFVEEKYTVKVSDFGLAMEENVELAKSASKASNSGNNSPNPSTRDLHQAPPRPKRIPVRWCAPEILLDTNYEPTLKSDVWSYGVLLWELFTIGKLPYRELRNKEVIDKVPEGYRLKKPTENCPDELFALMQRCWDQEPSNRPTFNEITTELNKIKAVMKRSGVNNRSFAESLQQYEFTEEKQPDPVGDQDDLYQTYCSRRPSNASSSYFRMPSPDNSTMGSRNPGEEEDEYEDVDKYQTVHGNVIVNIDKMIEKSNSNSANTTGTSEVQIDITDEKKNLYHDVEGVRSYEIPEQSDSSAGSVNVV